ncbi:hypothetical protein [Acuticoccus sp. I52.16.1]|uniref:hypothetical protein n=1 Tax=Acuticoccus sp. I52.16.1 TaxID=2928472 RepID=UPI001FD55D8F|nr:hypothetical protein [Acuticoccus sp. I52.16.1]UOM35267.1 hypothetical protein MRB58_03400 [Acuticoccus sp. I52.16.1]
MTNRNDKPAAAATRRDALKLVGIGAPLAAATTVVGGTEAAAATEAPKTEGLRKTEHVAKYLDSARF